VSDTDQTTARRRCGALDDRMRRCTRREGHDGDHRAAQPETALRHLRFPVDPWRRAAARAKREGYGVAEVAVALLVAYADERIDHPDHHHDQDDSLPATTDELTPPTDGIVRRPGRRPNGSGKHTTRGFRIADDKWAAGLEAAHSLGVTLASRLVRAVDDVIDEASRLR
jgi:hypothetical protein